MSKIHWFGPAALALLTCVGQLKASPLLEWVPVDLTILAGAIVALATLHSRVRHGPATRAVFVPWLLWLAFVPAVATSSFDAYAATKVVTLFTITLVLAVAPFYLLRDALQRQSFILTLAIVAGVVSFLALINPSTSASYTNRLVFEGADTIGTARVGMAGVIVLVIITFRGRISTPKRVAAAALAGITATLSVMSGSRGPVLAGIVALGVIVLFSPAMRRYRGRFIAGASAIGAVVIWLALRNGSDGLDRIVSAVTADDGPVAGVRKEIWRSGIEQLATTPFGTGWGSFEPEGSLYRYPHNILIELGIEVGWFVMVGFTVLMFATFVRGSRVAVGTIGAVILCLFLFSLINAFVSGDINGNRLLWPSAFALWAMSSSRSNDRSLEQRTPQVSPV